MIIFICLFLRDILTVDWDQVWRGLVDCKAPRKCNGIKGWMHYRKAWESHPHPQDLTFSFRGNLGISGQIHQSLGPARQSVYRCWRPASRSYVLVIRGRWMIREAQAPTQGELPEGSDREVSVRVPRGMVKGNFEALWQSSRFLWHVKSWQAVLEAAVRDRVAKSHSVRYSGMADSNILWGYSYIPPWEGQTASFSMCREDTALLIHYRFPKDSLTITVIL